MNRKQMDEEIKKRGFAGIRKIGMHRFYDLYVPFFDDDEFHTIGRPMFILRSGLQYRFASESEMLKIVESLSDE